MPAELIFIRLGLRCVPGDGVECRLREIERAVHRHGRETAALLLPTSGCFLLIWGLWYELGQDLWDYMVVTGAIYFPGAFAILLLGLYWKRASSFGAYLALLAGLGAVLGLGPVKSAAGLDEWSGAEIGLATAASAVILMILGSLATGFTRRTA